MGGKGRLSIFHILTIAPKKTATARSIKYRFLIDQLKRAGLAIGAVLLSIKFCAYKYKARSITGRIILNSRLVRVFSKAINTKGAMGRRYRLMSL